MEPSTPYLLQLIQLVGYAIIATVFVMLIRGRVDNIKVKIDSLDAQLLALNTVFARLNDLQLQIALQASDVNRMKEEIRELRHGQGFIRRRRALDRDYEDNTDKKDD